MGAQIPTGFCRVLSARRIGLTGWLLLHSFLSPLVSLAQPASAGHAIVADLSQKLEHAFDTGEHSDSIQAWLGQLQAVNASSPKGLGQAHAHRFRGILLLNDFQKDSALARFRAALPLYQQVGTAYQLHRLLLHMADAHFEIGNYSTCDSLLQQVTTYAQEENQTFLLGRIAYIKGSLASRQGNCVASVEAMEEALARFVECGNLRWQSMAQAEAGACLVDLGRFDEGIARYLASAKYYETRGEMRNVGIRYINIGTVFYDMGRYTEAIEYGYKAHLALDSSFSYGQAYVYNLLGISYNEQEVRDSAVYYFEKILALDSVDALQNDYLLAIVLSNLGEALGRMGQSSRALPYVNQGLALASELADLLTLSRLHVVKGDILLLLGEEELSLSETLAGVALAEQERFTSVLNPGYRNLATIYAAQGNYEEAYRYHMQHKLIDDSLAGVDKLRAVARLETEYETEKKENEIDRLSQEAIIQSLELSRKNTLLYSVSMGLVLVVAVFGVLYQQRQLRSKKKAIELEQRLLRAQMSPHFIFNTMVSLRNALHEKSKEETSLYLTKFSKLMRQILEHSRQEFISLQDEVETLENYCALQQFRYGDSFRYTLEVAEEIEPEEVLIPPMFAQPFIENALEHGIDHAKREGELTVRFSKEGDRTLKLHVQDNGRGIEVTKEIKAQEGTSHKSLALLITQERLANFGLAGTLALEQLYDADRRVKGTLVAMSLPYQIDL